MSMIPGPRAPCETRAERQDPSYFMLERAVSPKISKRPHSSPAEAQIRQQACNGHEPIDRERCREHGREPPRTS
jgi:hypothetical protein